MTRGAWLRLVVAALACAGGVALSWRIAAGTRIRGEPDALLQAIAVWWALFAIGAACLLGVPRRAAVIAIVVGAVALRVAALAGVPALSNDLDRYAWDGHVQAAGLDPYRYPPAAPQVARLRTPWLFPDAATCASLHRDPGCIRINRPHARTIYPPVAEAWFLGVHLVAGDRARDTAWQIAGLVVDLATLAVMLALLRAWGRDPRWAVLYAWCPAAVLEAVQNGHVDGLAALLSLLAVAAIAGRTRRDPSGAPPSTPGGRRGAATGARSRPLLAGALIGAATLVKLYPAVLGVLLLRRGWQRALAGFAAVAVIGYAPHVLAVGPEVLGYLPGYLREEDYAHGGRFLLLGALGLSGTAAQAGAVAVLVAVAASVVVQRRTLAPDAAARRILGALLLAATPVQPWYALPLIAIAALDGAWWWLAVAAAGYPYFFRVLERVPLPDQPAFAVGRLAYGAALAVVVAGAAFAAWRGHMARRSSEARDGDAAAAAGVGRDVDAASAARFPGDAGATGAARLLGDAGGAPPPPAGAAAPARGR